MPRRIGAAYPTTTSCLAPLGRHNRPLYDTFATTFPTASRTFAPCLLRICRYHSSPELIPLTRARIARWTSASVSNFSTPSSMSAVYGPVPRHAPTSRSTGSPAAARSS